MHDGGQTYTEWAWTSNQIHASWMDYDPDDDDFEPPNKWFKHPTLGYPTMEKITKGAW